MQLDLDHVKFWMDAIRNSDDKLRVLEAFWGGQLKSKEWLINNLKPHITNSADITIYGGWIGVLASLLFQSDIPISKIRSIDIDPECEPIANTVNKLEEIEEIEEKRVQKVVITGITTGFSDLNDANYGWQEGHLIIIAARPGVRGRRPPA